MLSHYDDDDDDEILRRLGEDPEEIEDDSPDGHPSTPQEPSDDREPDLANEEAEDDEDDGTTDSEQEEIRPKKVELIPTIRLTIDLPSSSHSSKSNPVEQSVSFLAKQAGYTLPADTAITFGASAAPEPEEQPPAQTLNPDTSLDTGPPPKRRRRKRVQERDEGYDKDDPFVDDSEAFIMEPKYYYPPARDGFFVVLGAVELKSNLKQPRVRKPAVKDPKKQSLGGGVPSNPPQTNEPSKVKRPTPLNTVSEPASLPQNPAPQSTSHKATQAKKIDSDAVTHGGTAAFPVTLPKNNVQSHEGTAALPVTLPENVQSHEAALPVTLPKNNVHSHEGTAALPVTLSKNNVQSQNPAPKPQPSTSQAPSSATARPSGIQPISHNARPLQSNSPKLIHGELLPASTQVPLKIRESPGVSSTNTPRQPPATSRRHSGTPYDPIYLCDDDERLPENQSSSKTQQAPYSASGFSSVAVPGPSGQTSQPTRLPYLKSRPLPERKEAGPLPRPLEEALDSLKVEIEAASPFIPKKFPNELKPSTLRVAQMALDMNEYDECFFTRLAQLFPYNTFTIKKFVKREILPQRKAYYDSQISERIARLKQMVTEGMPAARADYEAALLEYEAAKRVYDEKIPDEPPTALPANASTILADTVMKNPFDPTPAESTEKPPKLPSKSFKMNLAMRELIYELIKLEDELCETIKDTQKIVDKNVTIKDTSNRRQFYLRLAQLWPDEFMTTQKLSREVAYMKKKLEGNTVDPQNLITL
ncbi:hypothetical protein PSHT_11424 [Puccinia striiformis]|uniref:Ubinuclein middle domain-containing protein n=1 Tax=Puccinia striiformis TaxID=27350 RepID=A0A2S4V3F3_9BASI|nr:hypothetical protein PSHT_11424 [Puccinia striiformis]